MADQEPAAAVPRLRGEAVKVPTQLELDSLAYDCPHCGALDENWCRTKVYRKSLHLYPQYKTCTHKARQRLVLRNSPA